MRLRARILAGDRAFRLATRFFAVFWNNSSVSRIGLGGSVAMAWFPRHPRIEDLVTDHYESVYRFAYRLSGAAAEAEDLTQETFCQAQLKIGQLRELSAARGWLFSIVRNAYLHRLRSRKIAKISSADLAVARASRMLRSFKNFAIEARVRRWV